MNEDLLTKEEKTLRIEELEKVWTPEANWRVSTTDKEVVFVFPAFGPDTYNGVVKQVLANKQRLPTGEQNTFMLYEAHNFLDEEIRDNPRTKLVRENIIGNGLLLVPIVNVWTPRNIRNPGMYSIFDEDGEGLAKERSVEELEDRLSGGQTEREVRFSEDRKVAFAPLITIGAEEYYKGKLSQDGAFVANYGVEGAEKLYEVVKVHRLKPCSWIVNNYSDKPIQTLSVLYRYWNLGVNWFLAGFDCNGGGDGYVLSVSG